MREEQALLAGLVAVCAVSAAALVRLVAVLRIFRRHRQQQQSFTNGNLGQEEERRHLQATDADRVASSRVIVPSLLFHVLVFLCLAVEVPVYACRWLSSSGIAVGLVQGDRSLYALHMTSYLLLFMAFSVVVTLWNDVAVFEPNECTALMNRSMVALCVCYVLVTGIAVSVCLGVGNVKYFLSSFAFLLFCAYSIAVLLLLGASFLVLGCLLQQRICRVLVTGSCTARLTARIVRLNVVMLACFTCFTMRALMLAGLIQAQAEGEESGNYASGWKRREQDMRLEWALHVIPCVAMLYLMRKAGEPSSSSSSTATTPAGKEYGGDESTGFSGADVEDGYGEQAPGSNRYLTGGGGGGGGYTG
ncbi:hypothetical protein Esi_0422_0021 [Ectocarpus siliculosus]|uniref:THH1/TOM1/TOM3 domain-containing protein n=1 Tax=Ectocarpus siliculosus TaxID=2880 RepID=D8LN17_ECTSI|nr:hypothetical protein Esi_0422_0021 [Ectocarpus siliculosus]|eukprot:CBN76258.1 hypothetical protein Esi_0422_0021 [Ectocarpus siliculosus]